MLSRVVRSQNPYRYEGEECVLCLEGTTDYHLGERVYRLEAGDSVSDGGNRKPRLSGLS
jgi:uncharacterized cupin superfamily protein